MKSKAFVVALGFLVLSFQQANRPDKDIVLTKDEVFNRMLQSSEYSNRNSIAHPLSMLF